jgi:FAD/FMN-containing dehydrogenase
MPEWRNWSGSVVAEPTRLASPRTLAELQEIVRTSSEVRVTGAGHSFTPLCATTGTLLSLTDLEGEIEICPDGASAWVPAGWPIHRLTQALWTRGFSLANQGDIDRQAIAGALATGTHGTGATLGSLSTQALGFSLVMADGEVSRPSA